MYSSYEAYIRALLPSKKDLKSVTKISGPFTLLPSNGIYFKRYPYKVKLKDWAPEETDYYKRRREYVLRRIMFEDFLEQEAEAGHRIVMGRTNTLIYLRSYKDLKVFVAYFHQDILSVYGPINQEHINMLLSPEIHCAVRGPYYKKYDCKVYVCYKWNKNWATSMYSLSSKTDRISKVNEALDFFDANIPSDDIRRMCSYYRTDEFYTSYKHIKQLAPFINLQFPDIRMIITKCLFK